MPAFATVRRLLLSLSLVGATLPSVSRAADLERIFDGVNAAIGIASRFQGSGGGEYPASEGYQSYYGSQDPSGYGAYGRTPPSYDPATYGSSGMPQPTTTQPAADPMPISIVNPAGNRLAITYYLDDRQKTLEPGEMHSQTSLPVVADFDRGGQFGLARYTLSNGVYEFRLGPKGWELVTKTYRARIANTLGADGFRYSVDGQPSLVAAGFFSRHEGRFPMTVAWDRGDGTQSQKSLLDGTYVVVRDPRTGQVDLLEESEPAALQAAQRQQFPPASFPQPVQRPTTPGPFGLPQQAPQGTPLPPPPVDFGIGGTTATRPQGTTPGAIATLPGFLPPGAFRP